MSRSDLDTNRIGDLSKLISFSQSCSPMKVSSRQRDTKVEINNSIRVDNLRSTGSIPPDMLEFIVNLSSNEVKAECLDALESLYAYISSVKKNRRILDSMKAAKSMSQFGSPDSSLEMVNKFAKEYVSKLKKKIELDKQFKEKGKAVLVTEKMKNKEQQLQGLEDELPVLQFKVLRELRDIESVLASKGMKLK